MSFCYRKYKKDVQLFTQDRCFFCLKPAILENEAEFKNKGSVRENKIGLRPSIRLPLIEN